MVRAAGVDARHRRLRPRRRPLPARRRDAAPTRSLDECAASTRILLGAVGTPEVPPGRDRARPAAEDALRPRPLHQPAAVRRHRPGTPPHDFVVIRENTEGTVRRRGRRSCARARRTRSPRRARSTPAWASSAASATPSSWPAAAPRQHLTLVHKTNVLTFAGDLWQRTFDEVAAEYPDVATAYNHVDAACIYFVQDPQPLRRDRHRQPVRRHPHRPRRRGDRAASAWPRRPTSTRPAPARRMFEPVHGSAPDIVGTGKANPIAAILSAAHDARLPGRGRRRRPHPHGLRRPSCSPAPPPRSATPSPPACRPTRRPTDSPRGPPMPITPTAKIWMNGELVDWDDAQIHVLTHTLHYGTGVFEGIRAYETRRRPGRVPPHRPHRAAAQLGPDHGDGAAVHGRGAGRGHQGDGARRPGCPSCYIRPIAYYGYGEMGLNTLPCTVDVAIACWPWGAYLGDDARQQGRAHEDLVVDPPRPQHHAAGGQDHRQLRQLVAGQGRGAEGRLRRGDHAEPDRASSRECTGENIFVARNGMLITPPLSAGALEGITQNSVMTIARDLGFDVPRRRPGPQRPVHRRGDVRVRHRRRGQRR